ncbi:MAG: hypothetical protein AAF789_04710 [Bacteroidota bacterium]
MNNLTKWKLYAPIGLVLVGMGLCFTIESAFLKFNQAATSTWVLFGTLSLITFNSGLCFFGTAIIARVNHLRGN